MRRGYSKLEKLSREDLVKIYTEEIELCIAQRRKHCKVMVEVLSFLAKGATELSTEAFLILVDAYDRGGVESIRYSVLDRLERKQGGGEK